MPTGTGTFSAHTATGSASRRYGIERKIDNTFYQSGGRWLRMRRCGEAMVKLIMASLLVPHSTVDRVWSMSSGKPCTKALPDISKQILRHVFSKLRGFQAGRL